MVSTKPQKAQAATGINQQLNYQGRLLNAAGAVVPDGTYNMEFKIYQDGTGCVSGGSAPCGGTLKWTETDTGANKVTVINGFFSVQLGAVNPFGSSVDWNQDTLWLSVNIGGTGAPSWDGEMTPFRRLSAVPQAFNSMQLGGLDWSKFVQIAPSAVQSDSSLASTIFLNKTGASGNILQLQKSASDVLTVDNTGNITATGTYNTNTFTSSALSFGAASSASVSSAAGQALSIDSGTTGNLNLGTGANAKTINIGNATGATAINETTGTGGYTLLTTTTGNVSIKSGTTGSVTLDSGTTGNVNIGNGAGAKTITIGNATGATQIDLIAGTGGIVTTGIAATAPINLTTGTTGALTLDSGTTGAINIGTGANAKAITLGNGTGATSLTFNAGTGAINIGTNAVAHTTTIGNGIGASSVVINTGTGALNLGTNAVAHTVTIGNVTGATAVNVNTGTGGSTITTTNGAFALSTGTGAINLGTDAVAKTLTLGNSTGATTVNLNTGTGNFNVSGNTILTGTETVRNASATDDRIVVQAAATGAATFNGTITNADLTAARTYTLPDASGTFAVSATGPISLSAAGNISCATCSVSGGLLFTAAGDTGPSQSVNQGSTFSVLGGIGLTTTASATNNITVDLDNTTVTPGTYAPVNNANGSYALPQFTVDAQGRLTAASTTNVTLTGIPNSSLANSSLTINTTGPLGGGGAVSLGGSLTLTCATCLTSSTAFVQNGNAFGALATLGTTDANDLRFITNGTEAGRFLSGTSTFQFNGNGSVTSSGGTLSIISDTTNSVFLDSGTTGSVNIGTGSNSKFVNLGNTTGTSRLTFNAGSLGINSSIAPGGGISLVTGTTGGLNLDTGSTGTISIGTAGGAKTLNIGNATGATAVNITTGSGNFNVTGNSVLTGSETVQTVTATDDKIATNVTTGGAASFTGTITNADFTAARTYTLPNASGTLAVSASGPISLSALGDISCATCLVSGGNLFTAAATTGSNSTIAQGDTLTIAAGTGISTTNNGSGTITIANTGAAASCSATSNYACNGGNTLGAALALGTTDANVFNLITTGSTRFQVASGASTLTGQGSTTLTSTGSMTLNSAAASALTVDSGTTGALGIGTGANAKTITIGNATGATAVNINTGTGGSTYTTTNGAFALNTGTGSIGVGTDAVAKTITIGNNTGATALNLTAGTGGISLTTGAATNLTTTLGTTGVASFISSTANSDAIAIAPRTGGANSFTGTITSADLTAARTWTFPDTTGTVLLDTSTCPSTSTSFVCNGGNTTGAAMNVGTNDANSLSLRTSGTTRATFDTANGLSFPNGISISSGATNAISVITGTTGTLTLDTGTTGAINVGIGANAKSVIFGNASVGTTFTFNSGSSTSTTFTENLNSTTTASAHVINANGLTSGRGLDVQTSSTGLTGDIVRIENSGTGAGITGNGLKVGLLGATGTGTTLNITNAGTGLTFRANDDGTYTDSTPFVIDASGNVGIGTASPGAKLDVRVATNAEAIRLSDGTDTVGQFIVNANPNGSVTGARGSIAQDYTNGALYINTNDATAWTQVLTTSGNCSASTTIFCQGGNSFGAAANLGTNDANILNLRTGGTTQASIGTTGTISLNTSGTNTITTGGTEIKLEQTGDTLGTSSFHIQNRFGSAGALIQSSGPNDVVDIGFVAGSFTKQGNWRFEGRPGFIYGAGNSTLGEFEVAFDATGTYPIPFVIGNATVATTGSQNFGIGNTNPQARLHVDNTTSTSAAFRVDANSVTTATAATINANGLTSGTGLAIASTGTGLTGNILSTSTASTGTFTNGGVLFNFSGAHSGNGVQITDATTAGTAMQISANSLAAGNGLVVTSSSTSLTGNIFSATSASTSAATNGLARFNFTGAHTGNGLQIDDVTATGNAVSINTTSLTTGSGLVVAGSGTTLTGNIFRASSASTAAATNGLARFNFTGAHTGNGLQIDDATVTGTALSINASALTTGTGLSLAAPSITTGNAVQVTGTSGNNLFRVHSLNGQAQDLGAATIGNGAGSKPDTLARDQLYVFGRINSSWNMFSQDFVTRQATAALTADSGLYGAFFNEVTGASGSFDVISVAGASGVAQLDNPTSPAANENEWFGTAGVGIAQGSLNPVLEARMMATTNTDQRSLVGFSDQAASSAYSNDTPTVITNGAYFRKNAAGTVWIAVTRAGGVETTTTTAVGTGAFHILRIEMDNTNGNVKFFADGTNVATHTTNIPASTTRLGWYIGNAITATTNRATLIDYIRVWSDDPVNQSVATDNTLGDQTSVLNSGGTVVNNYTIDNGDQNNVAGDDNGILLDRINSLEKDVSDLKSADIGKGIWDGGIVTQDTEFKAQVTFDALTTFKGQSVFTGDANFNGDVNITGHVAFGSDSAGVAKISAGDTKIKVTFDTPYTKPPVVTATPIGILDTKYGVTNITTTGFEIDLESVLPAETQFNWIVVGK